MIERRHPVAGNYGTPYGYSYPEPAPLPDPIPTARILGQLRKELLDEIGDEFFVNELVLAAGKRLFEDGITVKTPQEDQQ